MILTMTKILILIALLLFLIGAILAYLHVGNVWLFLFSGLVVYCLSKIIP